MKLGLADSGFVIRYSVLLLAVMLILVAVHAAEVSGNDEQVIRGMLKQYVDSYDFKDPTSTSKVADFFAENGRLIMSDGTMVEGREGILEATGQGLEKSREAFETISADCEVLDVQVHNDTAYAFMKVLIEGTLKENARKFERQTWMTSVLQKVEDRWLIVHEHASVASQRAYYEDSDNVSTEASQK